MRTLVTRAYLLHSRVYQESSALLTLFTKEQGKITCIARGIKRPKSRLRSASKLFSEMAIEAKIPKKSDGLYPLISAELLLLESVETLPYITQLSLHYINELIYLLVQQAAADHELFHSYQHVMKNIAESNAEILIRQFEMQLLEALGYGVQLSHDSNGHDVELEAFYALVAMGAPFKILDDQMDNRDIYKMSGKVMINIVKGVQCWGDAELKALKYLMRLNIQSALGGKVLQSRKLFREYLMIKNKNVVDS